MSAVTMLLSAVICVLLLPLPFSAAQSANSCTFSSLRAQGLASSLIVSLTAILSTACNYGPTNLLVTFV